VDPAVEGELIPVDADPFGAWKVLRALAGDLRPQ